jgi:hypothetical protein
MTIVNRGRFVDGLASSAAGLNSPNAPHSIMCGARSKPEVQAFHRSE